MRPTGQHTIVPQTFCNRIAEPSEIVKILMPEGGIACSRLHHQTGGKFWPHNNLRIPICCQTARPNCLASSAVTLCTAFDACLSRAANVSSSFAHRAAARPNGQLLCVSQRAWSLNGGPDFSGKRSGRYHQRRRSSCPLAESNSSGFRAVIEIGALPAIRALKHSKFDGLPERVRYPLDAKRVGPTQGANDGCYCRWQCRQNGCVDRHACSHLCRRERYSVSQSPTPTGRASAGDDLYVGTMDC